MKQVIINIRKEISKYIESNNIKSLVLGVSGGIDSAVVAALMRPVVQKQGIDLIGVSIPMKGNKYDEIDRAKGIGNEFCTKFYEVNKLDRISDKIKVISDISDKDKIRFGNIKARLRMIYLYDIAQKNKGMVLSTDNWTELMLGFWTLHGDVGDYGCIQNLTKTEVYEIAEALLLEINLGFEERKYNALYDCIKAIPTDGLGISDSDYEQLGVSSYQEADEILQAYLYLSEKEWPLTSTERNRLEELMQLEVVKRHIATEFKRNNPYNIPRHTLFKCT